MFAKPQSILTWRTHIRAGNCQLHHEYHSWIPHTYIIFLVNHCANTEAPMCNDHVRIRRLGQVNAHTLIVFIAPNRLCDYEKLLHQNVRQHAVFPIPNSLFPSRTSDCSSAEHCWHTCCRLPTPDEDRDTITTKLWTCTHLYLIKVHSTRFQHLIPPRTQKPF